MIVRVTQLESYRRGVCTEYGDLDALLRDLRGKPDPPNWKMEAGSEFHRLLASELCAVEREGHDLKGAGESPYKFRSEDILLCRKHSGPGLCEVTGFRGFGPVTVKGTCDRIRGTLFRDAKVRFGNPDVRDYEQSLQWRFYLLLFGGDAFTYDLFDFRDPDDQGWCELRDIVSVRFWRYPGMEADCKRWVRDFMDWARLHGLDGLALQRAG